MFERKGILDCLDRLVLTQVKREQLGISCIEALVREVDVGLLWLEAAERDNLRHLRSRGYDSISTFAKLVLQQTATQVQEKCNVKGADKKANTLDAFCVRESTRTCKCTCTCAYIHAHINK